jgi:hypothetical protein
MGRNKLTDKQMKKIISDYAMNNNKSETARINNVTETTVRRLLNKNNDEVKEKVEQKTEENTKDILEYIDTQFDKQKKVIELSLEALENKLRKPDSFTNVKDIATVYGIFSDKAIKTKELKLKEKELNLREKENNNVMNKLDELLEAQKNA